MKSPLAAPHDRSLSHRVLSAESAPESVPQLLAQLSARRSAMHERQVELASWLEDCSAGRSLLTLGVVDRRLFDTARFLAELLELAERAAERFARRTRSALDSSSLAETCFDAILRLDGARHQLRDAMHAEASFQHKQRQSALLCAQDALTHVEQHLSRVLSN